jgi:hypothetical protein
MTIKYRKNAETLFTHHYVPCPSRYENLRHLIKKYYCYLQNWLAPIYSMLVGYCGWLPNPVM